MDEMDYTEEELLRGCIAKDKEKWDIFVQQYSKLIYHSIYKTLRANGHPTDPEVVNDLFQDVFSSLCSENAKKLRMFDPTKGCTLPSWLRMIAVRMTIDHLRKQKPLVSIDDLPGELHQTGNQEDIDSEESLSCLKELFADLPPKEKLLLELTYIRELPSEEVAQILKITVGAFYTRKNRIIEKLKKITTEKNIL